MAAVGRARAGIEEGRSVGDVYATVCLLAMYGRVTARSLRLSLVGRRQRVQSRWLVGVVPNPVSIRSSCEA